MTTDLEAEIERLTAELAGAEAEAIRLQARIQGIRAQRDSLAASLAAQRSEASANDASPIALDAIKRRTEAITTVLSQAGRPMSIEDVKETLDERWREPSSYAVVASTLNLLQRTGRISKVARGMYVAA